MGRKYSLLADEIDPRHRSTKDKARWCRGKIGVEHQKKWLDDPDKRYRRYEHFVCSECNKEFDRRPKQWTLRDLLYELMVIKKKTVAQVVNGSGLTTDRVERILAGKHDPNTGEIKKLAEALDVAVELRFDHGLTYLIHSAQRKYFIY